MDKYYYKLTIGNLTFNLLTPDKVVAAVKQRINPFNGFDEQDIRNEHHAIEDWHQNLLKEGPDWEIFGGAFEVKAIAWAGWQVNLTYFKDTGKYYSTGKYISQCWDMFQIFEEVGEKMKARKLPDLVEGHSNFHTTIDVPDHPYNHPHLFLAK